MSSATQMTASAAYRASHGRIFQISRNLCLALAGDSNNVVELDPVAGRVLACCQGARSLEAHASAALAGGAAPTGVEVASAIDRLVMQGLLRGAADWGAAAAAPVAAARPISAITVITADRPTKAARCLTAIGRQCDLEATYPRLILVDGSHRGRADTAAVTETGHRTGTPAQYVGPAHAQALCQTLAAKGIPPSVLRFALTPGQVGCNRNLALLLTAGGHILMADDDVICSPWAWEGANSNIAFGGHEDPRHWQFHTNRSNALNATNAVDLGLLRAHADVLGAPVRDLTKRYGPVSLDGACEHLISAITGNSDFVVRVTLTGLAGDSGRYCPRRLLLLHGPVRDLLRSSDASLAAALTSREVCRAVRQTTLTHDAACQTHFVGVSNRELLPPFIPKGRNEDGLFGAMLAFMLPRTLFAHMPHGVVHDSDRVPDYAPEEKMPSAQEVRLSEYLLALLPLVSASTFTNDPAYRLRRLGQALTEVGEMKGSDFAALIKEVTLRTRCQEIAGMVRPLSGDLSYPPRWRGAVEEYVETFRSRVDAAGFFVPVEFRNGRVPEEELREVQHFIREFGDLIKWWPDIWKTARDMNQNGE